MLSDFLQNIPQPFKKFPQNMGKQRHNKHNNKILDKSNKCNITHTKFTSRHSPLHKITNVNSTMLITVDRWLD